MNNKPDNELILLPNRYNDKNYIERIAPNVYEMPFTDFMTMTYDKLVDGVAETIYAVDPPGGPYMAVDMIAPFCKDEKIIKINETVKESNTSTGNVKFHYFIINTETI